MRWKELLLSLIGQAKDKGLIRAETDDDALALLIMSVIEGSLLICKAGKDTDQFQQTAVILKTIIASHATP